MSNSIELKIENKVAYITLNRPEVFNSFNREMAFSLQDTLDACEKNDTVRAIVLTGNGKAFCAGQDLKEVTDPELNPGFKKILDEHYNPIITKIRNIRKPIIPRKFLLRMSLACEEKVSKNIATGIIITIPDKQKERSKSKLIIGFFGRFLVMDLISIFSPGKNFMLDKLAVIITRAMNPTPAMKRVMTRKYFLSS